MSLLFRYVFSSHARLLLLTLGVGVGLYPSVQEACQAMIQLNPAQEPIPENVPQYEAFYQVYKSLYPALKENYKLLAATGT